MNKPGMKVVQLPGHFVQVQLGGLKDVVDHHLENDEKVSFDACDVERVDGAAIQFLLAVSQLHAGGEKAGQLVINANEVLVKALDDMGVSDVIAFSTIDTDSLDESAQSA